MPDAPTLSPWQAFMRDLAKAKRWDGVTLAEKLGVHKSQPSRWFRGLKEPSPDVCQRATLIARESGLTEQ